MLVEIKKGKTKLKERVEETFCTGNAREAWDGIKTLTGKVAHVQKNDAMTESERREQVERLNDFYCRFDVVDFASERDAVINNL